ncbi:systemin receptor SR160-like [Cornus florida]|uniref:systemin receptor SR160-like n=1 Tax=Cornus florida TaxID=4283 RepID=UPI002897248A|nr:systemin receptor SR160-like [Cornus florida]
MKTLNSPHYHHHYHSLTSNKLFLYVTLLSLKASSASINGLSKDSQQLLNFKASLSSPNTLQNWHFNKNPCNFTGVLCRDSRVSSIDLSFVHLNLDFGSVCSFLITLPNLETLSLKSTNLTGSLKWVAKSRCSESLSSIDVAENGLSGSISELSSLSSCSSLRTLNLSKNNLDFTVVAYADLNLNLEFLDLSNNRISGESVLPWLFSGGCGNLRYLSLKGNKVAGAIIPVSKCLTLEHLDLSQNNLSSTFPTFSDCSVLQHLDLSSNKFSGDISTVLSGCKSLSFLNLTNNLFSGPIPKIPSGSIELLYLSGNDFHGEIPWYVTDVCSSLVELDISENKLSGTVPESFSSCSSLQLFDISSNNFSGELPIDTLLNLTNLKTLVLSFNNFDGGLSDSLSKLPYLETLDLSSNNLSGSIPWELCGQDHGKSLKVLYLQNNNFNGPIPESLSNCSELVSLDLSFNFLNGTIPSSLGSLSKLKDLIIWLNQLHGEIPNELMYIQTLENLILDFNELEGTIPAGLGDCTNLNWISLSNNRLSGEIPASLGRLAKVVIIKLGNNSINGSIPPELGDCRSLLWLDLSTNKLSGTIPPALFKQSGNISVSLLTGKRYAYIKNDGSKQCHGAGNLLEFGGIRPEQLNRISTKHPCNFTRVYNGFIRPTFNHNGSMIFLDLSYNMLDGSIPKELGSMHYLSVLNLGHNDLSGSLPEELDGLNNVAILDLSYNRFNGLIPQSLTSLSLLSEIDLSNNNFSGMIPQVPPFDTLPVSGFMNNSGLCGYPLPTCGTSNSGNSQHQKSHRRQASLAGSVAMGLLFSLFCIFGLIIIAVETNKRRKKEAASLEAYIDGHSHSGTATTAWKLPSVREALSITLETFEKPLRNLTFADLLEATNRFHIDGRIGSGGFGDVYKAQLKDGSIVAIKKLKHISGQGDREFTAEIKTIGKIKHRNLVPLLGYCKVGGERLLVYEYMKYGSLFDVLHDRKNIGIKLNWAARRKIAIGAASGLAFLHDDCTPRIIHRDMKSSNVLLNENLEARVSDFGMARLMSAVDTHLSVSTLEGTPGYVPPEYYQSFRCSTEGDVYSYGVVLLELLTGKQPIDSSDFGDNNLVGWVKQHANMKISDVFDPRLMNEEVPGLRIELLQHLKVACACLDDRPWLRPTMIQVMAMFKEIQAGSGIDSSSAIGTDDQSFSAVGGIEMSIKEDTKLGKQ